MSKSQQLIDTRNALFTTFTFWFHFFRSADKIDEVCKALPHTAHIIGLLRSKIS